MRARELDAKRKSAKLLKLFVSATEAHDDDGLPHTLEHLVFLGSEDYPYKGVLDLLANRCLASGTNAWTGRYCTVHHTTPSLDYVRTVISTENQFWEELTLREMDFERNRF